MMPAVDSTVRSQSGRGTAGSRLKTLTISHTLMQEFIDVMQSEHNAPSTIALERALLRSLFNHAFRKWNWYALCDNPATKLRMPKVDNCVFWRT